MKIEITKEKHLKVTVGSEVYDYKFLYGAIRNKVEPIFRPVIDILQKSQYISNLMDKIFLDYIRTKDELKLYSNFVSFKWAVKEYVDRVNLFKEVKALEVIQKKKNAIFFSKEDLLDILYASYYLKFYVLFYATELKPSRELHGKIFSNLLQGLSKRNVLGKIYKLIQVKVFASASSDKPFWQYLKFVSGDSPDTVCINTYVNMLENVLPALDGDKNPATYIVVYATKTVDYIFVSAYNDVFFYESMFYYDVTESQQSKVDDLLPGIILKSILEKTITPLVNQVYTLDVEKIKRLVEVNPLSKIVAIPFFAKLVGMPLSVFKELNIYYTYVISLYVSYIFKTLGFNILDKLLTCTIKRNKNPQFVRFTKKKVSELTMFLNSDVVKEFSFDNKLFQRLLKRVKGLDFIDITTEKEKTFNLDIKVFVDELYEFYKNLFSGKFSHTFKKLRDNNMNCYVL